MIDTSKEAYRQYRERAQELYNTYSVVHGDGHGTNEILHEVKVPHHANVQICDGGAFVEAVVWVPKSKFHRPQPINGFAWFRYTCLSAFVTIHEIADIDPGNVMLLRMGTDDEL